MSGLDAHRRMAACILASSEHDLSQTEILVLQVFAFHANRETLRTFAAVSRLMALTGKSRSSCKRAIARLVELGLLTRAESATGRSAARFVAFADLDRDQVEDLVSQADDQSDEEVDRRGVAAEPSTARSGSTGEPPSETVGGSSSPVEGSRTAVEGPPVTPEPEEPEEPSPPSPPEGAGGFAARSAWAKRAGTPESRAIAFRLKRAGLLKRVPALAEAFVADGGTAAELEELITKAQRDGQGLGLLHRWLSGGSRMWRDVLLDGDERERHEAAKRCHVRAAHDSEDPVCGSQIRSVEPLAVGDLISPQSLRWAPSYAPPEGLKEASGQ